MRSMWKVFDNKDILTRISSFLGLIPQLSFRAISRCALLAVKQYWSNLDNLTNNYLPLHESAPIEAVQLCLSYFINLKRVCLSNCEYLQRENMGDLFLKQISETCRHLTSLDISRIRTVTDEGVEILASGHSRLSLKEVDISFCSQITYKSVLMLRGSLRDSRGALHLTGEPLPVLVRRIPTWLQGRFFCPWGEVHTYYPDGSFSFDRESENIGWLSQLFDRGNYTEDRIKYIGYSFSPGVLVQRFG